jgi:4-amino-4-deoxy-L-arabinose transferase-like glycosyltransferase
MAGDFLPHQFAENAVVHGVSIVPFRNASTGTSRDLSSSRAALGLAVAAFALSILLSHAYPLLDPDEGRNAEVAREMAASGSLLVPTLAGMPYLDKPPGFFWAGAVAIRLFGSTPWAARLPAALAAALTLLLLGWAARRLPPRTALLALGLLATAPLFAILSAYVIFDIPLTLCVTALWVLLAEEVERGPGTLRRAAMFAAVAAGVLIKGPVMLAWALGGSLGAAILLRAGTPLRWLRWPLGWVIVFGAAGGWFALASARYPEYPHYAFLEESLERITTGSFHREHPLWFVPVILIAGALPWSLATPWTIKVSKTARVGLGFVLFAILFFTASHSKLATYLLPCFPPMALVAAESWNAANDARRGAWGTLAVYAALALLLAAVGWGWVSLPRKDVVQPLHSTALALVAVFAVLAGLSALAALTRRAGFAIAALLAFTPVTLAVAGPALIEYAISQSGEPLGRSISLVAPKGVVRFEHCYSAGTEFTLGGRCSLLSERGAETTSTYQARYRETLIARGQWTILSTIPSPDTVAVIVRPNRDPDGIPPPGMKVFFRDRRFIAYTSITP